MEYTTLGKTGVTVSRLGFGGAVLGLKDYLGSYDPSDERARTEVRSALETAVELGITYFDTAAGYGDGASEELFGDVLGGLGSDVFVATKVLPGDRDSVRRSVERSLRLLRRDSIDLLQIHGTSYSAEQADAILGPDGTLETMNALRDSGAVRFLGFTSEDSNPETFRLIRSNRFDVLQICYNFIFQHPYEPSRPFGTLYEAEAHGMGIVTMRTATSGSFQRWIQTVNPENTFDYTPALIQFVLSNPLVDVALVGVRSPELVVQNARIVDDLAGRVDIGEVYRRYV